MVNYQEQQLDQAFAALANGTRRAILARLATGVCTVSELAAPFDMSLPAVSKHLRVLERAGLVRRQKDGRIRRMSLDARPMRELNDWIERYRSFWDDRLDSLSRYLEPADGGTPPPGNTPPDSKDDSP